MLWVAKFIAACNVALVLVLAIGWAAGGLAYLGVHGGTAIAVVVGIVIGCELLIVLMALLFYSEQSGLDEAAAHVLRVDDTDRH